VLSFLPSLSNTIAASTEQVADLHLQVTKQDILPSGTDAQAMEKRITVNPNRKLPPEQTPVVLSTPRTIAL
jgi:hypothetical protein